MNQCSRCEPKSRSVINNHRADVKLYDAVCRQHESETSEKGSLWKKNSGSTFIIPTHDAITVNVSPNPASTWVTFDYSLPFGMKAANLQISDVKGKVLAVEPIFGNQGQKVVDTRPFAPGVYFYTIQAGNMHKSGKFIIK